MPESREHQASRPADDRDREEKVEQLLLVGLDHYLAGQYEQAINVWTRVLFLDRKHPRARAYIDRARSALAERQRESEELLDSGVAALRRGETAAARRLIASAVDRGGSSDDALVVLERLDRLEAASGTASATATATAGRLRRRRRPGRTAEQPGGERPSVRWLPLALAIVLGGLLLATAATWDQILPLLVAPEAPAVAAPLPVEASVPVPRRAEFALTRAHSLFQRGHLREALHQLDRLPAGDPLQREVDALRATIQRTLLTGSDPGVALNPPEVVDDLNKPLP